MRIRDWSSDVCASDLPMPRDPRLLRIAQALADDPGNPRRVDEWARWAAMAPRTLIRRYVPETGLPFSDWRPRLRLIRALDMLARSEARRGGKAWVSTCGTRGAPYGDNKKNRKE